MLEKELNLIRMRCEKTTEGPWVSYVEGRDHTSGSNFIMTNGEDIELLGASIDDQDFIAHAKQDIPKLLKEVERLKQLLDKDNQTYNTCQSDNESNII